MTTATRPKTDKHTTKPVKAPLDRSDGFHVDVSEESLGYNKPQVAGRALWLPMLVMAVMGWGIGFALAIVEAGTDRTDLATLQDLGNLVPAFMFVGFLGVFSAITFAIARILGEFRKGGGEVQALAGDKVQTIKMPSTAKLMLVFMAMGMMVMIAGIATNFASAANFDATAADLLERASWGAAACGLGRLGVALYLVGITFGLGTIIEVLRFQSIRIGEVAKHQGHEHN
ncbi:MAG: hypothetical protein ACC652_02395 [Acidimicrobiales bacterium]